MDFDYIEKNLREIHGRINNAKLNRDNKNKGNGGEVRLMAVTKTVPAEKINFATACGVDLIGENRVDELLEKYDAIDKNEKNSGGRRLEIHFIGNLQTNKVRRIIDKVDMIQSVNSVRLAEEINKRANLHNKIMDVLLEVNIGCEENKIGIGPADCREAAEIIIRDFRNIRVCGLMTIPPFEASLDKSETSETGIRAYFNKMRELLAEMNVNSAGGANAAADINMNVLSMGMSEDFEEAVECGSNIIRIGTKIFGGRN